MDNLYSIDNAATLLGVDKQRIIDEIEQRLISTTEKDGEKMITPKGMMILFDNISNDESSTRAEVETKETKNKNKLKDERTESVGESKDIILVDSEELLILHERRKYLRNKHNGLVAKMRRLEVKAKEYKNMESGVKAEFWHLAKANYPKLWQYNGFISEELDDGVLIIRGHKNKGTSRETVQNTIEGWIKDGSILNTPMGLMLPPDKKDEHEEHDNGDTY